MRIKLLILFSLLICHLDQFAQSDSGFIFSRPGSSPFPGKFQQKGLYLDARGIYGSSSLNAHMVSDYLFSDHFTERAKSAFLQSEASRSNLDADLGAEIRFYTPWSKRNFWLGIEYQNRILLDMDKKLSQLILFGNKPFAGQALNSQNNDFLRYQQMKFLAGERWMLGDHVEFRASGGLVLLRDHFLMHADELGIFTQSDGEYLNITVRNLYTQVQSGLNAGLTADLELIYHFGEKSSLSMGVSDLNMVFAKAGRISTKFDNGWQYKFEGLNPRPSDLYKASWDNLADSVREEVFDQDTTMRNFILLPTGFQIQFMQWFNDRHGMAIQCYGYDWTRYGYHINLVHQWKINQKMLLRSGVKYSNFSNLIWSEEYEYIFGKLHGFLSIYGLSSLLVPTQSTAYGLRVGMFRAF